MFTAITGFFKAYKTAFIVGGLIITHGIVGIGGMKWERSSWLEIMVKKDQAMTDMKSGHATDTKKFNKDLKIARFKLREANDKLYKQDPQARAWASAVVPKSVADQLRHNPRRGRLLH